MLHISIPLEGTMEYISETKISPYITKGICKVCYVSDEPNRNKTVITKEFARELGRYLPGSPLVGFYDKEIGDFLAHEREISVENGELRVIDLTQPYGFVPTDAKVWFQVYEDDGVPHEYLVTEAYLWSEIYEPAKMLAERGIANQSMELDRKKSSGVWTNHEKTHARIFIYNEGLIEKLCILGINEEPCFEGSQVITTDYVLKEYERLRHNLLDMIQEVQTTLDEGGFQPAMNEEYTQLKTQYEELQNQYSALDEEKKNLETEIANLNEFKANAEAQSQEESAKYAALLEEKTVLEQENAQLKEYKLAAERKEKDALIDSFYMLSDADKNEIRDKKDEYSLHDIEAHLSILCVRNKVSFNLESDTQSTGDPGLFSLAESGEDSAPAWIKAIRAVANNE